MEIIKPEITSEEIFDLIWNDDDFSRNFACAWREMDKCNPSLAKESLETAKTRLKTLIQELFIKKNKVYFTVKKLKINKYGEYETVSVETKEVELENEQNNNN